MSEKENAVSQRKLELLKHYNQEANQVTQECIETALLLLMQEKDFDDITITEITSRAGVSRTAYYRNYASKEDVLRNVFNRLEDAIMEKIRKFLNKDSFSGYSELFQAFAQEAGSFQIILKAGMSADYVMEMNRRFTANIAADDFAGRYNRYFWMGALANVVFMWIQEGMRQTPEEMAAFCRSYPIRPDPER